MIAHLALRLWIDGSHQQRMWNQGQLGIGKLLGRKGHPRWAAENAHQPNRHRCRDRRSCVERRGDNIPDLHFFIPSQPFGNHGLWLAGNRHPPSGQQSFPGSVQEIITALVGDTETGKGDRSKDSIDVDEKSGGFDGAIHTGNFADLRGDLLRYAYNLFTRRGCSDAWDDRREDFGVVIDRQYRQVNRVDDGNDRCD